MSAKTKPEVKQKSKISLPSIHKWNVGLGFLHLVQGLAVAFLSTTHTLPVTTSYLTLDKMGTDVTGQPTLVTATRHLFDVNLGYLVAAFFFMSAIAHFSIATWYRKRYERNLGEGVNKARWIEYAFSASTMMVAIGFLSGITDLSTFIAIFALNLIMNLMGMAMEVYNEGAKRPNWLAYAIGCIAGAVPWLIFVTYVWGASVYGQEGVPGFVYGIYVTIFLSFNCFALNMWLQYSRKGKWADYLYGERVYMILSLVAKTLLAWQVFAGTLRP